MKKKLSISFLAVGVLVVILVQEKSILCIQNFLNVPSKKMLVGEAEIKKPESWMLTSSREGRADSVVYFGFIPNLLIGDRSLPEERYLAFRDMAHSGSSITIMEVSKEFREKMMRFLAVGYEPEGCRLLEKGFNDFRAIKCVTEKTQVVFVPDLALSITLVGIDSEKLEGLEMKRVASRS